MKSGEPWVLSGIVIAEGIVISEDIEDIQEIVNHVLHVFGAHADVEREGDFVFEEREGVGGVGYVEAEGFVGRHHRQGLVVHVGGAPPAVAPRASRPR